MQKEALSAFGFPYYITNIQDSGNPIYTPKKTKFKGYMRDKSWIKRHKKK